MFLINLNAEIFACILSFRKSRHKPNLESTSKYGFSPDLGGKNGGVLSMRMQVILDSSFARPGSAPIWDGKKGEFMDWTTHGYDRTSNPPLPSATRLWGREWVRPFSFPEPPFFWSRGRRKVVSRRVTLGRELHPTDFAFSLVKNRLLPR